MYRSAIQLSEYRYFFIFSWRYTTHYGFIFCIPLAEL